VNFLIDVNLPPSLCDFFGARGHRATAVRDVGLRNAEDDQLWTRAEKHDAIIVTKDEDFAARRSHVLLGPQIVWIRIGNVTNKRLEQRLSAVWDQLIADLELGTEIIEVR
jgi:predicted nuclease of predicted toxin-antitoxin system